VQVLLGPLLGFVMKFVPHPVISDVTSYNKIIKTPKHARNGAVECA